MTILCREDFSASELREIAKTLRSLPTSAARRRDVRAPRVSHGGTLSSLPGSPSPTAVHGPSLTCSSATEGDGPTPQRGPVHASVLSNRANLAADETAGHPDIPGVTQHGTDIGGVLYSGEP